MDFHILSKDITSVLLTFVLIIFTTIDCFVDNDSSSADEDSRTRDTSVVDKHIVTDSNHWKLGTGRDVLLKLIRFLLDTKSDETNNVMRRMSPRSDLNLFDDDILSPIKPKIHIHHIFPPHLIRPLQKVIIQEMIDFIKRNPIRKFKRRVKKVARMSTVAVGLGVGVKELLEMKAHPPAAHYRVTGIEDLSAHKNKYKKYKRTTRMDDMDDMESDLYESDEKTKHKDYELVNPKSHSKHAWPFYESKDVIYEKWNKFPLHVEPDPIQHKVKYLHKSFHELQPELVHMVNDLHGLVGTKTKQFSHDFASGTEDLESPIVLLGQFFKLIDSLIPSIRIRIPFIEYLIKSFHVKSKPKVVYVNSRPQIQYVGLPVSYPEPEPLKIEVPITVPVPEPIIVPEPVPYGEKRAQYGTEPEHSPHNKQQINVNPNIQTNGHYLGYKPKDNGNGNYEIITRKQLPYSPQPNIFNARPDYNFQSPPPRPRMIPQNLQVYHDRKRAKA